MALGPIPFPAIIDYFNAFGLSDFEEFHYVIRHMDNVYLELNNEVSNQSKGESKSNGTGKKGNSNKN